MEIQWYPGHMAKAKRKLIEELRRVDVVVELLDARAPRATRNPDFARLCAGKARVVLLNKSDLANDAITQGWLAHFRAKGLSADAVAATGGSARKRAVALIERAAAPQVARMADKGVKKVVRAMIVGIPNVGKSTLINRVAGARTAAVGDRPGVTRSDQWVKITPYLELLDTPGMLWPKLDDQKDALHLAFLGSIRDEILDEEHLATRMLAELQSIAPAQLAARYAAILPDTPETELLTALAKCRGFLLPGGVADTERAARIALDEFRAGRLGRVSLERAPEVC